MKKLLLLVAAFLGISAGAAQAACTSPAVMHDFPGTSFNMSLATAPDTNCESNIAITTWGGVTLGAPSNYGTSPGAVAVPGVNAFITNTPSVSVASSTPEGGLTDTPATAPASATSASMIALLKAILNTGQYPAGAVAITASATGTSAATTATLAGTTGKTTYVCGYSIRANATANTNVTDTLTGVVTGTMSSALWVPANTAGLGVDEQIFSPCIPASATNTGIAAVSGAPGSGGVVTVKAWGYQL